MPSLPSPRRLPKRQTLAELKELQRVMAQALFRPLSPDDEMQSKWVDGRPMEQVAAEFIKRNSRLTSFERLEIYSRSYWFRVLDCLYDDFPALATVLGGARFHRLITEYLAAYPSSSFTLRDLGSRMDVFIRKNPALTAPHAELALDCARFEWAQVVAFDGEARPPIGADDLLGADPDHLQLEIQPYITLLDLSFPLDDFAIALKRSDAEGLRDAASNAVGAGPTAIRKSRVRLPKRQPTAVAVHRHENQLYFKRLDPASFHLLAALRDKLSLSDACERAALHAEGRDLSALLPGWFHSWTSLGWFCR